MPQFEYAIDYLTTATSSDELVEHMNAFGLTGWEFFHVHEISREQSGARSYWLMLFRRRGVLRT